MAKLYVLSGDDVGKTFEVVGDQAILGRGKEADMVVRGLSVSRKHARVERGGDGWRLVDLGSSNGIRLGGMKVSVGDLVDGEVFHLGEVELRFRSDETSSAPIEPREVAPVQPIPIPDGEPPAPVVEVSSEPVSEQASVVEDFDLEGDWDEDAPVEIQPVRSAPTPPPVRTPSAPVQPQGSSTAARRAEALGGAKVGGTSQSTSGSRPLQYHKVEDRRGLLGADLGQQTSTTRWLIYVLVVAMFAALCFGAYTFTAASKRATAAQEAD